MHKKIKLTALFIVTVLFSSLLITQVNAQEFLPDTISDLFGLLGEDGSGATQFVTSRVQSLLLIGLALLILSAVVYSAFSAYKYISSQGDAGQVEESGKAVKAIFLGIAVLLLSVVGIALIFVFFGTELISTELYQVCVSEPNSRGCIACNGEGDFGPAGLPEEFETIKFATSLSDVEWENSAGTVVQADYSEPTTGGTTNRQLCTACEWGFFRISRDNTAPSDFDEFCTEEG
jgi:hypothetical protein